MADMQFELKDHATIGSLAIAYKSQTQNKNLDGTLMPLRTTRSIDPEPQKAMTTFNMSEIMQGSATVKPSVASYDVYNQYLSGSLTQLLGTKEGNPDTSLGNQKALVPEDVLQKAGILGAQAAADAANASGSGQATGVVGASSGATGKAAVAVSTAVAQVGKPYVWGAVGPDSFDCSGLMLYAWHAAGVDIPHYTVSQYGATTHIAMTDIQPGDLIFTNALEHVGMYIGNNQVCEAPHTGDFVKIVSFNDYWQAGQASRVEG